MLKPLVILLILLSSPGYGDVVTIRADEWYPVNGRPGAANPGYMIEIAKKILVENGHSLDYQTLPWRGSLKMVRKGRYDCVVGADHNDAPDFVFTQEPWGFIKPVFYIKKESAWRYRGIDSLRNIRLGVIGDYAYTQVLEDYIARNKDTDKVQIVFANKALRQNIGKLMSGRLDVIIEYDIVMDAKLRELGHDKDIISVGSVTDGQPLYIACSPNKANAREYIRLFAEGFSKMRTNGELAGILQKYGLKDWQ
ncbi:substrate-binding periplasmic protein [Thalassomonas actiniarum]|uniref:Transporter substrate-binding domain-containing protein n=1 Tax=Thalassomonas actiniarum TaxID=485447 RepID=A0AAE9YXF9_9GAMM|nr:transporter substrate-binding domain-containing protein [Thalassomonas actiniarum]WDE01367.1 transporter substrate-binding domain-containing protein [Thalassomonas actiniarum]